jgi:hypothetical protein
LYAWKSSLILETIDWFKLCLLQPIAQDFNIKEAVKEILTSSGYGDKRAKSMDNDDFLTVLEAFNSKGYHFT